MRFFVPYPFRIESKKDGVSGNWVINCRCSIVSPEFSSKKPTRGIVQAAISKTVQKDTPITYMCKKYTYKIYVQKDTAITSTGRDFNNANNLGNYMSKPSLSLYITVVLAAENIHFNL